MSRPVLTERAIEFLWKLKLNNEKSWFESHKDEYVCELQAPLKAFSSAVFDGITADFGSRGFVCRLCRIYKDARRVRGGEPYRTNMWFSIEKPCDTPTAVPMFWFGISTEEYSYGLGYYQARPSTMAKLRARIDKSPKAFEKLISRLDNQDEFVLRGPEYARRREAPSEKTAEWYNKKSFSLCYERPINEELFSPELAGRVVSGYRFLMPFYDYFISLDTDPLPAVKNRGTC